MITGNVFAISDLHLSFARSKPMDIFGDHWIDHPQKIASAWKKNVTENDIVLIGGDVSWAIKLESAQVDLDFVDSLPGHKVMIRGNHDFWYPKSAAKRKALPQSINALYRSSCVINGVAFIGCKGLSFEKEDVADEGSHKKDLKRQLANLEASLNHLRESEEEYSTIVALIHYPPAGPGETKSPVTKLLEEAGVSWCIYGHLHSKEDFDYAIQGQVGKVNYSLTSADYLSFTPSCFIRS